MTYSFCISAMYRDLTPEAALADLSRHGFDTVECWMLGEMAETLPGLLERYGMRLSAFCPDFFVLNDPAQRDRYLAGIEKALIDAKKLGCHELITQVGADNGRPREEQHQAIVDGLRAAAPMLESANVTLLVEPLNTVKNHPEYYLSSSEEAFEIVQKVNSPCVKVLFDVYHQLHMGEDVMRLIQQYLPWIGHFHVAGFPQRDEKLWEGFDHSALFNWLKEQPTAPYVGVELIPSSAAARTELLQKLQKSV